MAATTGGGSMSMPDNTSLDGVEKGMDRASVTEDLIGSDGLVKEHHWNDKEALDLEELVERITLILQNEKNIPLYKRKNIKQLMRYVYIDSGCITLLIFYGSSAQTIGYVRFLH
eukprot:gb/GECG01011787.1/.p1 GENE.gb/GECG01011787.1/~~gb/GECG01011787.1/.p1  ORF type:complete len:114 (+),score=16.26 gb/GECG01011787.1/:1-342(+)